MLTALTAASLLAAPAPAADRVLVYSQAPDEPFTLLTEAAAVAGASVELARALPAELSDYALVFVVTPAQELPPDEVELLRDFGGTLVLISEAQGYYGREEILNLLLAELGYESRFAGESLDARCAHTATTVAPHHYLSAGVSQLTYAYSDNIIPGPLLEVLIEGELGQPIVGVEGELVLMTDTTPLTNACEKPTDNALLVANLLRCIDGDGDGVVSEGCATEGEPADCDDADPGVYPGAEEIVDDGIDQDCDGLDAVTCYVDSDGDGYGSAEVWVSSGGCDKAGLSRWDSDCDDSDPSSNPAGEEIPDDGIDQDCSGWDAVSCYLDDDGDGYGAGEVLAIDGGACADFLMATRGGDCAPRDDTVYPGAEEIAGDGIDQDCDGEDLAAAVDTGLGADTAAGDQPPSPAGCGCAAGLRGSPWGAWGLLPLLIAARRRLDAGGDSR